MALLRLRPLSAALGSHNHAYSKGFEGGLGSPDPYATLPIHVPPLLCGARERGAQIAGGAARQGSQTTSHLAKSAVLKAFPQAKTRYMPRLHARTLLQPSGGCPHH